jgi:hypothetical protein
VRDLHEEEAEEDDDVDKDLQRIVRDVGEEKEADGLPCEHAEIHPSHEREICLLSHEKALHGIAAAREQQHDRHGELRLVEEHEEGGGNDDETEARDGLNERRKEDGKRRPHMRGDAR